MFGIIADLIASVISIALPCYLSYKSLRTHDPAQTTPWLIYFIILSLTLLAESWTVFIVGWFPFYSWFRLFFLLYLVLPQTQGAKHLYLTYFEPFILQHEKHIDDFIGQTHKTLEQMGLGYMNIVVEWIREKILGQASPQANARTNVPPGAQGYASYASDLLSRFAMPAARTQAAPAVTGSAGGVLNMLSSAAAGALAGGAASTGSTSRSIPASAQAASIPDTFMASTLGSASNMSVDQKSSFIGTQRDRLQAMLKQLDKEQRDLDLAYGEVRPSSSKRQSSGGLHSKSTSQMSFDNIDYDDVHSHGSGYNGSGHPSQGSTPPKLNYPPSSRRTTSGNWVSEGLGGWLGSKTGSPRDDRDERDYDQHSRDYERRDDHYRDVDHREDRRSTRGVGSIAEDFYTKGWSSARDISDTIARGGTRDNDRYDR